MSQETRVMQRPEPDLLIIGMAVGLVALALVITALVVTFRPESSQVALALFAGLLPFAALVIAVVTKSPKDKP